MLVIVLIIFGPKRLPELGRSMGRGIKEFRGSVSGEHKDQDDVDDERAELEANEATEATEAEAAEPVEGEVVTEKRA